MTSPLTWSTLPYAHNLAELTVVDLADLGASAPSMEEILRITAPGGVAYVEKSGAWKKTVKAWPNAMDSEFNTHEYDATGNIVSKDQLVGPATSLQWISDYGWSNAWGVRLTAGRFFYVTEWKNKSNTWFRYMAGRSAWNGVPFWKKCESSLKLKMPFIAAAGKMFTVLKLGTSATTPNGGPVVAFGTTASASHKPAQPHYVLSLSRGNPPPGLTASSAVFLVNGRRMQERLSSTALANSHSKVQIRH